MEKKTNIISVKCTYEENESYYYYYYYYDYYYYYLCVCRETQVKWNENCRRRRREAARNQRSVKIKVVDEEGAWEAREQIKIITKNNANPI